jgi:hypothetical protein
MSHRGVPLVFANDSVRITIFMGHTSRSRRGHRVVIELDARRISGRMSPETIEVLLAEHGFASSTNLKVTQTKATPDPPAYHHWATKFEG